MISIFPRRKRNKKLKHLSFQVDVTVDDDDNVIVYLSQDKIKIMGIKTKLTKDQSVAEVIQDYISQYVKLPRRYKKHEQN